MSTQSRSANGKGGVRVRPASTAHESGDQSDRQAGCNRPGPAPSPRRNSKGQFHLARRAEAFARVGADRAFDWSAHGGREPGTEIAQCCATAQGMRVPDLGDRRSGDWKPTAHQPEQENTETVDVAARHWPSALQGSREPGRSASRPGCQANGRYDPRGPALSRPALKSISTTRPLRASRMTFCAFTSRCSTPASWTAVSARHRSPPIADDFVWREGHRARATRRRASVLQPAPSRRRRGRPRESAP